jgi:anti-sigma regulatory factor (Ser/Thr protein kinase)
MLRIMSDSRAEELALLYEAAGLLGRTLDPDVIYDTLQAMVARAMDCASLLVSIHTPEDNLIRCVYAWDDGRHLDPARFPPIPLGEEGQGMQSRVIRSGEPLMIADAVAAEGTQTARFYVHGDGRITQEPDPGKPRARSLIIVPITLEGRVLGAAQVISHRPNAYTQDHLRLLGALLIQVAAATRNAYLYQQARAELAERTRVQAENARLLQQARENAVRQRTFLRDVLASVTEGALRLCDTPADLPPPLAPFGGDPVPLSLSGGLRELRHRAVAAAAAAGLPPERGFDLEMAVGEAGMNAIVHAGEGVGEIGCDPEHGLVQVRITDQGEGIAVENLPRATLERGYSTKATLGHGMKMMLQTTDTLWLLTGPTGTIVVMEQRPRSPDDDDPIWP